MPYDAFAEAFLNKVTEYEFIRLDVPDRNRIVDGYMKRACARFRTCRYDITRFDDPTREIQCDIPPDELHEIVDIVSEGMVEQFIKPHLNNQENLENILNTSDFRAYSPAELTYRITSMHDAARKNFNAMVKNYSFEHGDLSNLSM